MLHIFWCKMRVNIRFDQQLKLEASQVKLQNSNHVNNCGINKARSQAENNKKTKQKNNLLFHYIISHCCRTKKAAF